MFEIKNGIVMADKITESTDFLMFSLSKTEIEICSTYRLEQQIIELRKIKFHAKNILALSFSGYDFDSREVYNIGEIKI